MEKHKEKELKTTIKKILFLTESIVRDSENADLKKILLPLFKENSKNCIQAIIVFNLIHSMFLLNKSMELHEKKQIKSKIQAIIKEKPEIIELFTTLFQLTDYLFLYNKKYSKEDILEIKTKMLFLLLEFKSSLGTT